MTRVRILAVLAVVAALATIVFIIHRAGVRDGVAKVTATVQRQHAKDLAEVRADQTRAAVVGTAIAAGVGRADAEVDDQVQSTLEEMRDALAAVHAAPDSADLPAAPVERLRDQLNASIARANRAADPPAAR
jgi:hypothetical protein